MNKTIRYVTRTDLGLGFTASIGMMHGLAQCEKRREQRREAEK